MQDGLFASTIRKYTGALHAGFHQSELGGLAYGGPWPVPSQLLDWNKTERCALHVAGSSAGWALADHSSKEIVESFHIVMGSLQQANEHLHAKVEMFVMQNMVRRELQPDENEDDIRTLWVGRLGSTTEHGLSTNRDYIEIKKGLTKNVKPNIISS